MKKINISLNAIFYVGVIVTLLVAFFNRGIYHFDEHYQILEYINYKLFNTSPDNLAWEFETMMRPAAQPFIGYLVGKALVALGLYSPWILIAILQVISAAISISCLLFLFNTLKNELSLFWQKWFVGIGLCMWCLTYLHVHFSSEMLTGNLAILLAALMLRYAKAAKPLFRQGILLGLVAGGLFITKFQTGFMLLGLFVWMMIYFRKWNVIGGFCVGGLVMLGLGICADYWLYGTWTLAPFNYLNENILNSHMAKFGAEPWYYYFTASALDGGVFFGLILLASTIYFFIKQPRSVITWMLIPFLAVHFFLAHKEIRFFFPALFFAPYLIVFMFQHFQPMVRLVKTKTWHWILGFMAVMNVGLLVYMVSFSTADVYFYKMMEQRVENQAQVKLFNVSGNRTYYSWEQSITAPRLVVANFYLTNNMELHNVNSFEELEMQVDSLVQTSMDPIYVLSNDPELEKSSTLNVTKINWNPYPAWIVKYFNFNNWTAKSVYTKNIYSVAKK